jgi:hypothetical protein
MKSYLISKFRDHQNLLVGFLLAFFLLLMPFLWQWDDAIMTDPENYIPLDPARDSRLNSYLWSSQTRGGYPWLQYVALPYTVFLSVIQSITNSHAFTQKLWFSFLLSIAGCSIYWLVVLILDRKNYAWLGGLCAALFYVLNPFFAYTFNWNPNYPLAIAILPLAMVLYLQTYRGQKVRSILIPLPSILVLALAAPAGSNVPLYGLVLFIFITFMIAVHIIYNPYPQLNHLIPFAVFIFVYILINLWWLLPMLAQYENIFGGTELYEESIQGNLLTFPTSKSLVLLLFYWLDKYWQSSPDSPFYPFANIYYEPLGILILFGVALLVFSVLIMKDKPKIAYYFVLISLFGIIFGQGSSSSIGNLYRWLLINVPGFISYRSSDIKFPLSTIVGYAILLGISLSGIAMVFKKRFEDRNLMRLGILLCGGTTVVISLLIVGKPVTSGEIVRKATGQFPGSRMNPIPDYWQDTAMWLDSQPGIDRVLNLPRNGVLADSYIWGYYGPNLLARISNRSVVLAGPYIDGYSSQEKNFHKVATLLYDSIDRGENDELLDWINLFNIGYIVYRNDLDPVTNWGDYNPPAENFQNPLMEVPGLSHTATFGSLDIFTVDRGLPRIFAASEVSNSNIDCSEIATIVDQEKEANVIPSDSTISSAQNFPVDRNCLLQLSPTTDVEFRQANPTRYILEVDAQADFWLVFSESFHSDWKAYIVNERSVDNQDWYEWSALLTMLAENGQRSELMDHYQVNAFANSWYVPKTGKYTIDLEFIPQRLYEVGLVISSITFIACIGLLIVDWKQRLRD